MDSAAGLATGVEDLRGGSATRAFCADPAFGGVGGVVRVYVFSRVVGVGGFWTNQSTDGSDDPCHGFNGWVQ